LNYEFTSNLSYLFLTC